MADDTGPVRRSLAAAYTISRTAPDELLRHDISDEELTALGDTRRDYLWEGMWVAAGIALAACPPSAVSLYHWINNTTQRELTGGDLFQVVVFFVACAIFAVLCYILRNKSTAARDLVKAIRERTRQQVG